MPWNHGSFEIQTRLQLAQPHCRNGSRGSLHCLLPLGVDLRNSSAKKYRFFHPRMVHVPPPLWNLLV